MVNIKLCRLGKSLYSLVSCVVESVLCINDVTIVSITTVMAAMFPDPRDMLRWMQTYTLPLIGSSEKNNLNLFIMWS